jgi:hypothetical protein
LTDPSEGPSTCPRFSLFATGYLIAEVSKHDDQSPSGMVLTCRVELSIYNGGDHTLTYYLYAAPNAPASQMECPSSGPAAFKPVAFVSALTHTAKGLVQTATFPQQVLHPTVAGVTYDAAVIKSSVNISIIAKRVKKGPAGHKKTVTIGLFATTFCPANHERQTALTFTQENGGSKTVTRLVRCHY